MKLLYLFLGMSISLSVYFTLSFIPTVLDGLIPYFFTPVDNPFYILIVGLDKEIEGTRRADVIIVAGVDLEGKRVIFSSIPRDLLYGEGKINAVYVRYGVEGLEKAVKDLTGIAVDRYVAFDYEAFKKLGDELGPITIVVKKPMVYRDYSQNLVIDFKPGVYEVYGEELLAYIRYRKGGMGDLDRIEREKYVLKKLIDRAIELGFAKVVDVYEKILDDVETDVKPGEVAYILLKLRGGFETEFVRFPYVLEEDGSVVVDSSRLDDYRKSLASLRPLKEERAPRILVVNDTGLITPVFQEKTERIWRERVGFKPVQVVWEGSKVSPGKNLILVLSEARVSDAVERVYPNREFEILSGEDTEGLGMFYSLLEDLSLRRLYPKLPLDAVVFVGKLSLYSYEALADKR